MSEVTRKHQTGNGCGAPPKCAAETGLQRLHRGVGRGACACVHLRTWSITLRGPIVTTYGRHVVGLRTYGQWSLAPELDESYRLPSKPVPAVGIWKLLDCEEGFHWVGNSQTSGGHPAQTAYMPQATATYERQRMERSDAV